MRKGLRNAFIILSCGLVCLTTPSMTAAQEQELDEEALERAFEEQGVLPGDEEEEEPAAEEPAEEDLPAEAEEPLLPELPRLPFQRTRVTRPRQTPPVFVGEAGEEPIDEARKIIIDGLVKINYVFNNAPESFVITYHFRIEGDTRARTAVMRGDAEIDAKVEGFLAKWPTGECTLNISIPKAPFQVTFRTKDESEEADINLRFTKPIMETWESSCTFGESGARPFVTKGDPERWLQRALNKTSPPLTKLVAKLSNDEKTTSKFIINLHQINDPPLGTIEADGSGVITVIPAGLEEEE